jgi:hypothetical protein
LKLLEGRKNELLVFEKKKWPLSATIAVYERPVIESACILCAGANKCSLQRKRSVISHLEPAQNTASKYFTYGTGALFSLAPCFGVAILADFLGIFDVLGWQHRQWYCGMRVVVE